MSIFFLAGTGKSLAIANPKKKSFSRVLKFSGVDEKS